MRVQAWQCWIEVRSRETWTTAAKSRRRQRKAERSAHRHGGLGPFGGGTPSAGNSSPVISGFLVQKTSLRFGEVRLVARATRRHRAVGSVELATARAELEQWLCVHGYRITRDDCVTAAAVARRLDMTPTQLGNWRRGGEGPAPCEVPTDRAGVGVHVDGTVWYALDDVARYLILAGESNA